MEAFVAASWLSQEKANPIFNVAKTKPLDEWMDKPFEIAVAHANGVNVVKKKEVALTSDLKGKDLDLYLEGSKIYAKEGYCTTCHQSNGKDYLLPVFLLWLIQNGQLAVKNASSNLS
jgi:hypothetical protein